MVVGQLISRSCTTGWSDWHHGDLFLTTEALIRIRLPEPTAEGKRMQPTVGPEAVGEVAPPADADRVRWADPRNRYLFLADIGSAWLHRGLLTDRLLITTRNGERHRFLWLKVDPAYDILRRDLPRLIGPSFGVD